MNHFPKITVVIPLYNGARYIRRSVKSVLEQSHPDFELVVVDDGSTDGGGEVVLGFTDPRLRLVRQENRGVSAARNRGIAEGRGSYVAFLDADDAWDAGFLDAVVHLSYRYPQAGIYATGYRMVFPKGAGVEVTAAEVLHQVSTVLITDYFYRTVSDNIINASGVMIPRRIFEEVGVFKVGELQGEDAEMWARIALRYPIGYTTSVLFSIYQTGMDNKPRFKNRQKYSPKVTMLQEVLTRSQHSIADHEIIRSHIQCSLVKMCMWSIINYDRLGTLEIMKNSQASRWAPLLNRLIQIMPLWPLLRIMAWGYRGMKSRIAIKMCGGRRVSYGVMMKLIDES